MSFEKISFFQIYDFQKKNSQYLNVMVRERYNQKSGLIWENEGTDNVDSF